MKVKKEKKKKLRYALGFALILSTVFISTFFATLFLGNFWLSISVGVGAFSILLSILLIIKQKFILAKYILILIPTFIFLIVSIITKTNGIMANTYTFITPRLIVIIQLLAPVLLFGLYARKHLIISTSIILIPTFLFEYFHNLFGVGINSLPYKHSYLPMFIVVFTFFLGLTFISVLMFQKSNLIYRKKIKKQNEILEKEKKSISDLHTELTSSIQKNAEYESLIEENNDVVFMLDKKGNQLYYNQQIETFSGFKKEELIGSSFEKLIQKTEVKRLLLKLNSVFKLFEKSKVKEITPFETTIQHKDGLLIPVEISGTIIQHNTKLVVLGTIRDITKRKKEQLVLEFQSSLYTIFNVISQNKPFKNILDEVLLSLLGVGNLKIEKKGIIFLKNKYGGLELKSNLNAHSLINSAFIIQLESYLYRNNFSYSNGTIGSSENHKSNGNRKDITPKGHYIIPIKSNEEIFGVLYLFTTNSEEINSNTTEYLETVATVLARTIVSNFQKKELEEKNAEISEKHTLLGTVYTELQESINYTRFLQKSLLPNTDTLGKHFNDSSILFMPKDRVSGDFYFSYTYDDYLYFGVGDCTGHGIPGAFLSSMSVESVKTVVHSNIGEKPNILLEKLRKHAKERFSTNSDELRRDSMDMALCLFDKKENRFYFSGGFIHLIIIRNQTEIIEYRGTKSPIGIYPNELPFALKEIEIEVGDVFYLTTDGYTDQFGSIENSGINKPKKFMRKRFRDLLLEINHLESETQVKMLKETINDWRQNFELTDDITVFVARHC